MPERQFAEPSEAREHFFQNSSHRLISKPFSVIQTLLFPFVASLDCLHFFLGLGSTIVFFLKSPQLTLNGKPIKGVTTSPFLEIRLNRRFATSDHVVQNPPCWRASSLLFPHWDIKTKASQASLVQVSLF